MKVFYQGRQFEASIVHQGVVKYYEIPGLGLVPESWVTLPNEVAPPAPLPELPEEPKEESTKKSRRSS